MKTFSVVLSLNVRMGSKSGHLEGSSQLDPHPDKILVFPRVLRMSWVHREFWAKIMKLMARKLTFTLTWLELTRVFFVIMRRMNFLWKRSPEPTTVGYSESSTDYCHPTKSCIVFVAEHTRKNYAVWFIISLIFLPDLTVHTVEPPERKETWKELSRSFNGRWFKALNPAKKERQV